MGQERIVSLQALRFVAAMMVVYHHTFSVAQGASYGAAAFAPGYVDTVCATGVDIFFVLSGFVITITGPLATPRPNGVTFFWRRWSRVAPLFYILSVLAMLGAPLNWDKTVATVFFWPAAGRQIVLPYNGNGWTLTFEMLFYSAVALLLVGGNLRRNLLIGVAAIAAVIGARLLSGWIGLQVLANAIFLEFGFGVVLACNRRRIAELPAFVGIALFAVGVAGFSLVAVFGTGYLITGDNTTNGSGSLWRMFLFGPPSAAIVAGSIVLERWARGPVIAFFAKMGDASYSIYLAHFTTTMFVAFVAVRVARQPAIVVMALGILTALAGGLMSHLFLEQPIGRWLRRVVPRTLAIGGRKVSMNEELPEEVAVLHVGSES